MIRLKEVCKKYEGGFAIEDLDLAFERGKCTALLGPNGAGKTTIIKMIIGLSPMNSGTIHIDREEVAPDSVKVKKRIGVVPQHINLDKELTVYENLVFHAKLYHISKRDYKARIEDILKRFDLPADRTVRRLSGGMKRKLMIAKVLMHQPDILILDEPTVAIDTVSRREIWEILSSLRDEGKTLILTTHYIDEAEKLADHVVMIDNGKIETQGTPKRLIEAIGNYCVISESQRFATGKHFKSFDQAQEYVATMSGPYSVRGTTLDDVFFELTNKQVQS